MPDHGCNWAHGCPKTPCVESRWISRGFIYNPGCNYNKFRPCYGVDVLANEWPGGRCIDTVGWRNNYGYGCDAYNAWWCAGGMPRETFEWTLFDHFNNPEHNCCSCGKGKWFTQVDIDAARREGPLPNRQCDWTGKHCSPSEWGRPCNYDLGYGQVPWDDWTGTWDG